MDTNPNDDFWAFPVSSYVDSHLNELLDAPSGQLEDPGQLEDYEFRMFSLFDRPVAARKRKALEETCSLPAKRPRQEETCHHVAPAAPVAVAPAAVAPVRKDPPSLAGSQQQCIPMPRDDDARLLPLIFSVKHKYGHLAEYFWVPRIVWFVLGVVEVIQTDLASPAVLFESKSIIEAVSSAVVYMQKTGALDMYHFAPERNGSGLLELIIEASLKIQDSAHKSNSLTQLITDLLKPFRYKCMRQAIKSYKAPVASISKAFHCCEVTPKIEYLYLVGDDDLKSDGRITAADGSNYTLYHAQSFTWNDMPARRGFCYAFGYRAAAAAGAAAAAPPPDDSTYVFKNEHMRCTDVAGRDLLCKAIEKFLLSEKYMNVARDVCCSSTMKDVRKFYFMGKREDKLAKYSMLFSYLEKPPKKL